ncbi:TolC family protein [Chitinophaga sp. HK235]|uniref:TolC family protein n=1 Tax=Chitinophaga sp. HK235 TaxID=2952571 RepID=UPI001BACBDEA|nr:TolC family protein [Chitinophaga sp. HK235]
MIERKKWHILFCTILITWWPSKHYGQQRPLSLTDAISLGIAHSQVLRLDKARTEETMSRYLQAKDASLPTGNINASFSHMEVPADRIQLGNLNWALGKRGETYTAHAGIRETIYSGNQLRYARKSALLLTQLATLDLERHTSEVVYTIAEIYHDLYKVNSSIKVAKQNLSAIDSLIKQANDLYEHGIVTKNDVLRFRLQHSEVAITSSNLESERQVLQYNLNILLGLPENTIIEPAATLPPDNAGTSLEQFLEDAFRLRQELKQSAVQSALDDTHIRSIRAEQLPTLHGSLTADYIHGGAAFIPPAGTYLTPVSIGATAAWNFSSLWYNKHKIATAKIQQQQTTIQRDVIKEAISREVSTCYQRYRQALRNIQLLQTAIDQASENNRIQTDRYKNNITSVTDLIDADSRLYQTLTNMEIARSDASLLWFRLSKAIGNLSTSH